VPRQRALGGQVAAELGQRRTQCGGQGVQIVCIGLPVVRVVFLTVRVMSLAVGVAFPPVRSTHGTRTAGATHTAGATRIAGATRWADSTRTVGVIGAARLAGTGRPVAGRGVRPALPAGDCSHAQSVTCAAGAGKHGRAVTGLFVLARPGQRADRQPG
jgi:hypothetical protein